MIRTRQPQGNEGVSLGEPRRRIVRKREGDPHPLGAPGSRHPDLNFDDDAPAPQAPVAKSSPREDAPRTAPVVPVIAPTAPTTRTPTVTQPTKPARTATAKAEVPAVLTWDAVRAGTLPAEGSGLPESLERDVPPEFRFWKAATQEDALLVREALVEAELFTADTVRVVNGEVRRVTLEPVVKMFLAPEYEDGPVVVPARKRPIEKAAALLSDGEATTALFDENVTEALGLETILEKVRRLKGDWVVAARDTAEVRKILAPAFRLRAHADLLFATSAELADPASVEWVTTDRAGALVKFATERDLRVLKAAAPATEDERIVMGVVLEPDEVDAQGDTISPEEIRSAAYKFMEDFQVSGIQHKEFAGGRVKIVESWIAPQDFVIEGQTVKAGTWMMTNRILDDALWKAAKEGKFTGFSIGGSAIRKPVAS